MAAPSSDGCREERPGHMSLQVAVEGGHGPEGIEDHCHAFEETLLTMSTNTPSESPSSSLGSPLFRFLQLLSTCVAFSLVARVGTWSGAISNWYLFIWCFCFVVTLIILIGPTRDHAIAATAFSCIAAVAYATEVVWTWACYLPGELTSLMGTMHSLLKLLQNFVASVIFTFICSPHLCQPQPALVWCVAVYPICFLLGTMALLLGLVDCDNRQPIFCIFLLGLSLLSVLPYASALVLWPLYQFSKKFGGHPQRSSDVSCSDELPSTMCICDQQLAVAILTAINLLTYMADAVYWALLVFVRH
ncbi:hypothetical protein E2I00_019123 [Balaenoptera physalus]|uniref:MARVEL domain-containing protein n=1 Tax=Balaenoptera physalus TaxID=9770 RepID=A0A643CDT5_BALPH|nr:hypothetical protein E2I00_019123 [Balaenoptera physalus]